MNNRKIVFVGPFTEQSGYSNLNRGFVKNLYDRGYDMGIENMRCPMELTEEEWEFYKKFLKDTKEGRGISDRLYLDESVIKIISWLPVTNVPNCHKKVLYTMAESKNINPGWIRTANTFYDEVWVPTDYYKNSFLEQGLEKPIFTIPIGIDFIYNKKNIKKDFKINYEVYSKDENAPKNPEGFKFLTVSRWTYRKGFDVLLKAFLRAFNKKEDVSLCLIARHAACSLEQRFYDAVKEQLGKYIEEFATEDSPPVYLCMDINKQDNMPSIYSQHDCYVSTSRGEGLSLPPMEASLMGLPCICPNHTGFSDYISNETALTFDVDDWEVCNENPLWGEWITKAFFGQEFPVFGESVINEFSGLMKEMVDNYDLHKNKVEKMREIINNKYTWEKCTDKAQERIEAFE